MNESKEIFLGRNECFLVQIPGTAFLWSRILAELNGRTCFVVLVISIEMMENKSVSVH